MSDIRWRLPFRSQNGTGCLLNIHDEGWTSSADDELTGSDLPIAAEAGVTILTGCDDPFYYEEDDDEDLLRVIRYQTGYINVIEKTYGALKDLMPLTNTEHYVEFFYGSSLVFIGYMQAQNFENDWVAAPRELHLPVMSPLGLAAGKTLNVINPPTKVSLATLLHEVCVDLYPKGTGVIMPDVTPSLEGTINSLVVCPANSSFSQSIATASIPYDPITYEELLEGICNCFGWMVHESVSGPVFSKFDHEGNYCSYTFANLPTMTHKQTVAPAGNVKWALGNYSSVADNDGKTSDILPLSKINLNFKGEWKTSASFDFGALRYHSESHFSNNHAAWFTPVDGLLTGSQLRTAGNMFNSANGYVTNYGATPALTGPVNNQEFCILTKVDTSWGSSTVLFQMQFANRPTAHGLRLTMTKKVGNRVSELVDINDSTAHHNIGVKVLVDGQYYRGDGVWGTSANPYELQSWDITNIPSNGPITLQFCLAASVGTSPVELVAIGDVKLEEITELYEEYKKVNDQDYPIAGASGSDTEAEVSVLFSYARENSNMVGDTVQPLPTHYDYLKTTQTRIQVPLRATLPSNYYQPMYSYWLTGWRWRLIAMAFHPWDDVYYLTLHRSVSLDDIAAQHMITVKGNHIDVTAPQYVHDGDYAQVTVLPQAGYTLDYVVVMMGYEDITADSYNDDGVVSIEHVTDDVTITAITTSIPDYLCFTALEAGQFTLTIPAAVTATYLSYIEWSKDGRTWNHTDNTSEAVTIDVQVASGDKVYWRGSGTKCATSASSANASVFSSSIEFRVEGNPMSLLIGSRADAAANPTASYSFAYLFSGCPKLNHVKCLFTDISATNCLRNWLSGVSSTGTFIQASGVTWPRGASGIPTGWVDLEKRTMPSGYKQVEYLSNPDYAYINTNRALNLNSEKVEIAFVKMASGNSCPFGNPTHNYRYGSLKVINISSALTIRVGVDYDDQVYKQVTISPVTADNPHTFQYVGNSSGFQLYFDGALKSTETCAWDAASPYQSNLLFSANTNAASSPASFHTNPIYYLKIWDNNNALAVDYVACVRESDNVAGFYDMAANTFHKSDNANDFTAGEEI